MEPTIRAAAYVRRSSATAESPGDASREAQLAAVYLWTPNALVADGVPFTDGELAFVAASLFLPSIAP